MIILEDLPLEKRKKYIEEWRAKQKEEKEQRERGQGISGEKSMYRCEQINITKMDDIPRSNTQVKTQFALNFDRPNMLAKVELQDYIYKMNPAMLNTIFDFIKVTEYIKHNVALKLGTDGKIDKVLNKDEIHTKWIEFKNSPEFETDFIKKLRQTGGPAMTQIIESGDKQFAIDAETEEDYRRDLFYMTLFGRQLYDTELDSTKEEDFLFRSIIIPDTIIPMQLKDSLSRTNDEKILKYTKVGTALISEEKESEIREKYDKYQKPQLQFKFTEYYLDFALEIELDSITRLPINARFDMSEGVKHNIESICEYKLRKLE